MKQTFTIVLIAVLVLFSNCGDNKSSTNEKQQADASASEKKEGSATGSPEQADDIYGDWELVGAILDTNDNLQADEGERKDLKPASYKDLMTLNRDGSGFFTVAKLEGRYEAIPGSDGKKLTWYDKANGEHRVGTIRKVTKDEMHIKEPDGAGLIIWKRL
ncbi:MAG TPA: hypothetical protein VF476_11115 [Chitinophagaceae bacterium]